MYDVQRTNKSNKSKKRKPPTRENKTIKMNK